MFEYSNEYYEAMQKILNRSSDLFRWTYPTTEQISEEVEKAIAFDTGIEFETVHKVCEELRKRYSYD